MTENHLFFVCICESLLKTFKEVLFEPSFFWPNILLEKRTLKLSFSKKTLKENTILFIPEIPTILKSNIRQEPYRVESIIDPEYIDVYPAGIPFQWSFHFASLLLDPTVILKDIAKLNAFLFSHHTIEPFLPQMKPEKEPLRKRLLQEKALLSTQPCAHHEESVFFKICYHGIYHNSALLRQEKRTKQCIIHTQTKKEYL